MTEPDHVKFVVAGSVALFESWVNGYRRCWEHPVKRRPRLTATTNSYVTPPHVAVWNKTIANV